MNIIKTLYRSCSRVSDMIDKVLKVILVLLVLGSALDLFLQVLYRFVLVHFVSFSMTWTWVSSVANCSPSWADRSKRRMAN